MQDIDAHGFSCVLDVF